MRTFRRPRAPSLRPVWRYVAALRSRYMHYQRRRPSTAAPPSSTPSKALADAVSLRDFELLTPLGRGSFGVVRLAQHLATGVRVALKALAHKQQVALRMERGAELEIELHASLSHPFVCSLLGSFEDARGLFLVLEFCPGGELYALLYNQEDEDEEEEEDDELVAKEDADSDGDTDDVDGDVLTPTDADPADYETCARRHHALHRRLFPGVSSQLANTLAKRGLHCSTRRSSSLLSSSSSGIAEWSVAFYLACLSSALRYLHGIGVLYRDLKLENVLLDAEGYVKLVDFGQSRRLGAESSTSKCGSPAYMAPEVLQRQPSDERADLWALGVVLFELLVGHTPFHHDNPRELARRVLHDPVSFPEGFEASHPLAVDLILKLLVKNPAERLQSVQEVQDHGFFRQFFPTDESWARLERREVPAPFVPVLDGNLDTRMFHRTSCASDDVWGDEDEEDDELAAAY